MTSTVDELIAIYPAFAVGPLSRDQFGGCTQAQLDRLTEMWFPGDVETAVQLVRIVIIGSRAADPVDCDVGSNTRAVKEKLLDGYGEGILKRDGKLFMKESLPAGEYEYHVTAKGVATVGAKRGLDDAVLETLVMDAVKRMLPTEASRKGSLMEAHMVRDMVEEGTLVSDPGFDAELQAIQWQGDLWVDAINDPSTLFPPAQAGEKTTVRPFFIDVMDKFAAICAGDKVVYRRGADGRYTVRDTLAGDVLCIPDATAHDTRTVGSRRPDINIYYQDKSIDGILRIVSSWELQPRAGDDSHNFSDAEIGQLIDTNTELLRQQPFRQFTLAVLTDGVRFQFFKISRVKRHSEKLKVMQSGTFLRMEGWAVAFALLLQPPAYFGYQHFTMAGYNLNRVIGQGAGTFVFEVEAAHAAKGGAPLVLKLFEEASRHHTELANLTRLSEILADSALFAHVPAVQKSAIDVTEIMSGQHYLGIISLDLCVPIRPERGGKPLRRAQFLQILDVLEKVHAERMFNCDLKPSNVLMYGDSVMLCDWGCAVYAIGNASIPTYRVGTVGFSDFTLQVPAAPCAAHDLKALVRTVYATYTDQLVSSDQQEANAFWASNFQPGSMWSTAMQLADHEDYDGLRNTLLLL